MNRRKFFQTTALSGGLLAVPSLMSFLPEKTTDSNVVATGCNLKIRLGDLELFLLSDGYMNVSPPQSIFAPQIPKKDFVNQMQKLYLNPELMQMSVNILLIKSANRYILIDAGNGKHSGKTNIGRLPENLIKIGVSPSDITDVFITHAHGDHIGGLTTPDGKLTFPNAQCYINKKEYDFWLSPNPDFSKTKYKRTPQQLEQYLNYSRNILKALGNHLHFFSAGDTLFGILKTELAEGHTPGHTLVTIISEGRSLKHLADTVHSPLLIAKPDWGVLWDTDYQQGIHTRLRVLENCYKEHTLILAGHLPFPGLGYIGKEKDYRWVPFSYASPEDVII